MAVLRFYILAKSDQHSRLGELLQRVPYAHTLFSTTMHRRWGKPANEAHPAYN